MDIGKGKGARLKGGRYKGNNWRGKQRPYEGNGCRSEDRPYEGTGGRNERRPYEGNGARRQESPCHEGKSLHCACCERFLAGCFSGRLFHRMNSCHVAHCLACSAVGAVVGFDEQRAIVFLFDSPNRACIKAVIVLLAFFLIDDIRHTASIVSGEISPPQSRSQGTVAA